MPPRSQTILRLCEAHQISTVPLPHIAFKAFAYLALHDQAFASLRSSKSCPRYTQKSKPLPYFTLQHNALLRFATPRRCRSMPVLAARRHASPSRNYAVPRLSVAPRREAVRCRAFPSLSSRIDAQPLPHNSIHSHCTSLPLHAAPLLCCADHGHSRPRHRAYSSTS